MIDPTTHVDYELFGADGKQVMFERVENGVSYMESNISDEAEAKTYVKDGLTLYKRTTTTTYEVVSE